jgi:four helix bundle protein
MDSGELKKRTKKFAHDCVKLSMSLPDNNEGRHIQRQIIRSSTSVAANYRAACHAQSKASFISKISIVIEESDETEFWLEFIGEENLTTQPLLEPLRLEAHELASIFITTRKSAQRD